MRTILVLTLLLLSLLAVSTTASARPDPVVTPCVGQTGAVKVCVTEGIGGTCVSVGIGLQGGSVCRSSDGSTRVCTSAYGPLGRCPVVVG